jgi:hypothetical protein
MQYTYPTILSADIDIDPISIIEETSADPVVVGMT